MIVADAEFTRKLFAQECRFVLAAGFASQFPETEKPEVAFIGRSNVGKSSLINALTGRKGLARASNTPGRTQQIVFFNLAEKLMLVDLPGYGHAEAPVAERDKWMDLVQVYMRERRNLKFVCLLLDGRHEVKDNDIEMMKFLDRAAVVYRLVLTKVDRTRPRELEALLTEVKGLAAKHPAALSDIAVTSSEEKTGIEELRAIIAGTLFKE
jgi:GTP-binding protein